MKEIGVLLLAAVLLIACGSPRSDESLPETPDAAATPRTLAGMVLGSADRRLTVQYGVVVDGAPDARRFVWRQGDGWRRWDTLDTNRGDIYIETEIPQDDFVGDDSRDCSWRLQATGDRVFIECSTGARNAFVILEVQDALIGLQGDALPARTIAGRTATCFRYASRNKGSMCLDTTFGVPLYLSVDCRTATCFELTAVSLSPESQQLSFPPLKMERNAVAGGATGSGVVSPDVAQLPAGSIASR